MSPTSGPPCAHGPLSYSCSFFPSHLGSGPSGVSRDPSKHGAHSDPMPGSREGSVRRGPIVGGSFHKHRWKVLVRTGQENHPEGQEGRRGDGTQVPPFT